VALSGEREMLYPSDFPLPPAAPHKPAPVTEQPIAVPDTGLDFEQTVGRIERQIIVEALRKDGWRVFEIWECATRDPEKMQVWLRRSLTSRQ
jgi:G:T-mismatch repair DNA endonuclease (very short patch repair protein)